MKFINQIIGIFITVLGVFLVYDSLRLYYLYHYTDILFLYRYPNYELAARFILGSHLIPSGILIILERYKGLKMLRWIAYGMIFYGIFRFLLNVEYWIEELFMGLPYILGGVLFLQLSKWNKLLKSIR